MIRTIALAICITAGAPSYAGTQDLQELATGRFEPALSANQTQTVLDDAVNRASKQFSWAFRGIARPRLAEVATACDGYQMRMAEGTFAVKCDGREWFEQPIGAPPAPWVGKNGEDLMVTVTRDANTLTLGFDGPKGSKTITYRWDQPDKLQVVQSIHSGHLPKPMVWSLEYTKRTLGIGHSE